MSESPISKRAINPGPTADPIVAWKAARLRAAGFSDDLARQVAWEPCYDLHALLELVDRGCPAELAVRILAPIEEPEWRC
jgi:hypothetical protein